MEPDERRVLLLPFRRGKTDIRSANAWQNDPVPQADVRNIFHGIFFAAYPPKKIFFSSRHTKNIFLSVANFFIPVTLLRGCSEEFFSNLFIRKWMIKKKENPVLSILFSQNIFRMDSSESVPGDICGKTGYRNKSRYMFYRDFYMAFKIVRHPRTHQKMVVRSFYFR